MIDLDEAAERKRVMSAETVLNRAQAETLLRMDADDLFIMLVPQQTGQEFYSTEGRIARGRAIFRSLFDQVRDPLCRRYAGSVDATKGLLDLTVLIATTLSTELHFDHAVVFPMAGLIVKIGLAELCKKQD